ncbi:MAG: LysR family transcriptional regulator [Thiolinea sp.]
MPDTHASRLARQATFRQLQVFECIARHRNFTKAAEELHLTQPTVSMQMKKLSDALGVALFEQIGRQVYLTEAGEALYQGSKNILSNLRVVVEQINHIKGMKGGSLSMTVISTAQYFMPPVIKRFIGEHPYVSISMRVGNKEQLISRIQKNQDDFYILGQPPEGLNVNTTRLVSNPLFMIAHADSHLAGRRGLKLADLRSELFLTRESGSGIRAHIERVFAELGHEPERRMVLGSNEVIRLGLLENMGIAVASLPTLHQELDKGELVVLDVEHFPIQRHWYLAYPQGKILSPIAQKFIHIVENASESLDEFAQQMGSHYAARQ